MEKSLLLLCMRNPPTSRRIEDVNLRYLTESAGSRALPSECVSPKKLRTQGVLPPVVLQPSYPAQRQQTDDKTAQAEIVPKQKVGLSGTPFIIKCPARKHPDD